METRFTQKDYILYKKYYDKLLGYFDDEIKMIEQAGQKTLWYFGAKKTLSHLLEEKGSNLNPRDIDTIIHVLLRKIKRLELRKNG